MLRAVSAISRLDELLQALPDEGAAVGYFTSRRWRYGEFCPYCRCPKICHLARLGRYVCANCGYAFSFKTGTLFHNSPRPMRLWLAVTWLATSTERGLTSQKVADELGIPAWSAWSMLTRLRYGARTPSFLHPHGTSADEALPIEAGVVGHRYEKKLRIPMPFEEAVDRFADVNRREVEASLANSRRLPRVQGPGWRRAAQQGEPADTRDDAAANRPSEGLVREN